MTKSNLVDESLTFVASDRSIIGAGKKSRMNCVRLANSLKMM
jgi:hypothetical protein